MRLYFGILVCWITVYSNIIIPQHFNDRENTGQHEHKNIQIIKTTLFADHILRENVYEIYLSA